MIREKRKNLGLTQEEMASNLNVSLRHYVRIDQETCLPRTDILGRLIKELKLTDSEIGEYIRVIVNKRCS